MEDSGSGGSASIGSPPQPSSVGHPTLAPVQEESPSHMSMSPKASSRSSAYPSSGDPTYMPPSTLEREGRDPREGSGTGGSPSAGTGASTFTAAGTSMQARSEHTGHDESSHHSSKRGAAEAAASASATTGVAGTAAAAAEASGAAAAQLPPYSAPLTHGALTGAVVGAVLAHTSGTSARSARYGSTGSGGSKARGASGDSDLTVEEAGQGETGTSVRHWLGDVFPHAHGLPPSQEDHMPQHPQVAPSELTSLSTLAHTQGKHQAPDVEPSGSGVQRSATDVQENPETSVEQAQVARKSSSSKVAQGTSSRLRIKTDSEELHGNDLEASQKEDEEDGTEETKYAKKKVPRKPLGWSSGDRERCRPGPQGDGGQDDDDDDSASSPGRGVGGGVSERRAAEANTRAGANQGAQDGSAGENSSGNESGDVGTMVVDESQCMASAAQFQAATSAAAARAVGGASRLEGRTVSDIEPSASIASGTVGGLSSSGRYSSKYSSGRYSTYSTKPPSVTGTHYEGMLQFSHIHTVPKAQHFLMLAHVL